MREKNLPQILFILPLAQLEDCQNLQTFSASVLSVPRDHQE